MNHVVAESVSNSCSPRVRGEGGRDLQPRVPVQPARRRYTDDPPVHQLGLAGLAVEILDRRLAACRFQVHLPLPVPPPARVRNPDATGRRWPRRCIEPEARVAAGGGPPRGPPPPPAPPPPSGGRPDPRAPRRARG